jgi:hypothetical protein
MIFRTHKNEDLKLRRLIISSFSQNCWKECERKEKKFMYELRNKCELGFYPNFKTVDVDLVIYLFTAMPISLAMIVAQTWLWWWYGLSY